MGNDGTKDANPPGQCAKNKTDDCQQTPGQLALLVLQDDVEGVNDARKVTEECEDDVDAQIAPAALLEEHPERWEDDCEDDLAEVASGERHVDGCLCLF